MKIVIISDTHGQHAKLKLPKGDLLIHAGDISDTGNTTDTLRFLNWFGRQDFAHKIFIAGNHDFFFERETPATVQQTIPAGITYLNDSGATINGLQFWGSPVTPWYQNWAFNRYPGDDINRHWNLIPAGTDILITHGPVFGILDKNAAGQHIGCKDLQVKMQEIKPRLHIFGHIHEGYGMVDKNQVTYINASALNEAYQLVNAPVVMEI